jgi:5-methyltetrahydropteroyltriglutamate--homocysteine methyltransferase
VRGPIGEGTLNLVEAWNFVKPLAARPLKFTVTSTYMLARTLLDMHYRDVRLLAMAIAEVLAQQIAEIDSTVLQVDEANLPGAPEDATWAHEPINRVLAAATGRKAVHLCFGDYGGQTIKGALERSDRIPEPA